MSAGSTKTFAPGAPTRGDRRRARELSDALRAFHPGAGPRELLGGPIADLLDASRGGSYSLTRREDGIRVNQIGVVGIAGERLVADLNCTLARCWTPFLRYDPTRPEAHQRNTVVQIDPRGFSPTGRALYARHGLGDCFQLRVLVCDGPSLLAWVGVLREVSFTDRERVLFRSLIPAMRERLELERQLGDAPLSLAALPAVLEAAGTPAFVLGPTGAVLLANTSARAQLDEDRQGTLAALRADVSGRGPRRFAVTRLVARGTPVHHLAIQRPRLGEPAPRAAAFAARHALTGRQAEVVALTARGLANKTIAAYLRCAESTVEMHLTAAFARAQVASRAELVARFWSTSS